MQDPVEQIKAKLDIVDVVGPYVELKKAGRNFKGLCPFHKEKTPSFMVSQEKQLAYCFSCRKGGDMFSFIQEVEGIEFSEAIKLLADRARVVLPTQGNRMASGEKQRLQELLEFASSFFRAELNTPEATEVKQYLRERGITASDIEEFGLGLAPKSGNRLMEALHKKGYTKEDMIKAGVVIGKDVGAQQVYDRFTNRIMFTLHNDQGKPIGFAGRIIHGGEPKYLNIPETILYHKGKLLYGWHLAKSAIRELDKVIVVEGYMDVIACHRAGVKNVVGVSGTALTEDHLQLINRLTKNVLLCFDEDQAGIDATNRSFEVAECFDVNILNISLPQGKDPDELLQHHPELFEKAITEARPFMEFFYGQLETKFDPSKPMDQKRMSREAFRMIQYMHSQLEQEYYLKILAEKFHVQLRTIFREYKQFLAESRRPRTVTTQVAPQDVPTKVFAREELILGFCVVYPELCTLLEQEIEPDMLEDEKMKTLYKLLLSKYTNARSLDTLLTPDQERTLKEYTLILRLYIEEHYGHIQEREREDIFRKLLIEQRTSAIERQLRTLHRELKDAQKRGDSSTEERLVQAITQLLPRLRR